MLIAARRVQPEGGDPRQLSKPGVQLDKAGVKAKKRCSYYPQTLTRRHYSDES